ncbi:MAG: toll/interleukin-1 receptor domain-containing protein, partial [Chloroflexi bacterium]|nr:toll/interleukin-1 receptor domain-containing protein [Chloroflexota bacterium]
MSEPIHVRARKFLQLFFNDEELTTFCFDYFPQVYNDFTQGMAKNQKVLMLVSYSQRLERFDELLAALERERPKGYRDHFAEKPRLIAPEPQAPKVVERNPRQIFISHASQDAEFAQRLAADLQANGWQTWMASDDIRPGEKWVEAINRGLTESGVFVLLLTPDAVASRWVQSEMNVAIGMEHRGEIRLLPLNVKPAATPALWGAYQWIAFAGGYEAGLAAFLSELEPRKAQQPVLTRVPQPVRQEKSEEGTHRIESDG